MGIQFYFWSKNSTVSSAAKGDLSNGQPIHLRSQIDVPFDTHNNNNTTNTTKLYPLAGRAGRRAVLIINQDPLRNKIKKKKGPEKAEKLLYEEFNKDGSVYLSYSMSNLDDVAKFFETYLDTEICHTACETE